MLERKLKQLKIKLDDKVSGQMMKFFKINASNDLFFKIGNGSIENKQIKSFANDYNSYLGFFRRRMGSDNTKIDKIADLNEVGEKARDYLMALPGRLQRITDRMQEPEKEFQFKWIGPTI